MVKQPVEDICGVAHANVDDLGAEGRVLVGDVRIEEFPRFRAVLGIDVAGTLSLASSPEALSIRGRCGSVAPVLCEGLPGLSVDEFSQGRGVGFIADVPGLQPRQLCITCSGACLGHLGQPHIDRISQDRGQQRDESPRPRSSGE